MEDVFSDLPDNSRLWVFAAADELTAEQCERAQLLLEDFTKRWKSHGAEVAGRHTLLAKRFILVVASSEGASTSGCSIDGLFRTVRQGLEQAGVVFADLSDIFFEPASTNDSQSISSASRPDFAKLIASGEIGDDSVVYDPSVQTLGDFRSRWRRRFADSWHAELFAANRPLS